MIDPFQNEALGNLLLSEVKKITDLPVKYVVNTHFHFDHTGGNKAIKAQEIPIVGRGTLLQLYSPTLRGLIFRFFRKNERTLS